MLIEETNPDLVRLFWLAHTHINTQSFTPQEENLWNQLDELVERLINNGVSEERIVRTIADGEMYHGDRDIPQFATRRYLIQRDRALERARDRFALEMNEDPDAWMREGEGEGGWPDDDDEEFGPNAIRAAVNAGRRINPMLLPGVAAATEAAFNATPANRASPAASKYLSGLYYNKYLKYKAKYFALKNKN
jgi:hypothetical protein